MPSRPTSHSSTRQPLLALALAALYLAGTAAVAAAAEVPAFDLKEIKTIFSFGDSWTTTGYTPSEGVEDVNQTATTSGGPTWVQYLAWNHTSAASSYYDLASLGATISTSIVYSNGATDFAGQTGEFLAYFNSSTSSVQWDSDTSLFTIFFGNDDVYNTYANGWNFTDYQPRLLTAYDEQVGKLYEAGARNFLLLSLPSLSHSPLASSISGGKKTISTAVEYWNDRLEVYARFLEAKYPGVRGKWFDARGWTGEVLSNPSKYGYDDATSACEAYSSLVKWDPNANDKSCEFSLSTYFWKDFFRPTWRVHEQMAAAIASLLSSPTPSLTLPTNSSSAISSLVPSGSSATNFSALLPSATSGSVTSVVVATETSTVSSSEPEETEGAAGGIRVGTNTSGAASGGGGPSWLTVAMAAVGAGVVSLWTAG